MQQRTRLGAAVAGTVGLFVLVQFGALALVDPYVAADAQPVEDPGDPGNVALFFGVLLVATALMLAAMKFDLDRLLRGFVLLACGWITWLVSRTLVVASLPADVDSQLLAVVAVGLPAAVGVATIAALVAYPEWYVVDAAGVLLGAGAAGLFGLAFTPQLTVVFLVVLAAYDAVSVYGTEHMLELAEGVSDMNVPVLLVIPTVAGYSLLDDDGPDAFSPGDDRECVDDESHSEGSADAGSTPTSASDASQSGEHSRAVGRESGLDDSATADSDDVGERDALYVGLGDAVMPTILAASAAAFLRESAPLYDVPLLAVNAPALGAMVGTVLGLVVLLWLVLRGRAHAGLPLLNGGAIGGYLVGAVLGGVTVVEALGLPL